MKIGIVTTHLTNYLGATKFIIDYSNELIKRGHQITIIAQRVKNDFFKFNEKIRIIELGGPLPKSPLYWLQFFLISKKYTNYLNKLDLDIILTDQFPTNYFCSEINYASKKLIYYCQEPFRYFHDKIFYLKIPLMKKIPFFFFKKIFKKYDLNAVKRFDLIIANSRFTKKRINKIYQIEPEICYPNPKINYNYNVKNNIEIKISVEYNIDQNYRTIFAIGYSHFLKGASQLMEIFKIVEVNYTDVCLLIGGKISNYNKNIIKKKINKLKIPPRKVICIGFIDNEKLKSIYKQVDLTVYTAIDEAFGYIPIESQYNGTPVISFEGGPSETIINNVTGYIIKNNNIKEFAEKVLLLLRNNEKRKNFGKRGKDHIIQNFLFQDGVDHLEKIIKRITKKLICI